MGRYYSTDRHSTPTRPARRGKGTPGPLLSSTPRTFTTAAEPGATVLEHRAGPASTTLYSFWGCRVVAVRQRQPIVSATLSVVCRHAGLAGITQPTLVKPSPLRGQ